MEHRIRGRVMNIKNLKIVLIIGLLIALLPMPYGYFSILRIYAVIVFCILLFHIPPKKQNSKNWVFICYIALIILFQPIIKIPLGRTIWNIIDLGVAIWMIISLKKRK
ncbi:DUF6804 family protein [Sphingobacterium cellulitidis]|uniref:DUF6804 family protein n=1 Tax=Sphingobacterium cellulitidis TaxID=1768011 RepID=UPI003C79DC2E